MKNSWNIESLYDLRYYNCPSCDCKTNLKQEFINHAYDSHPEIIYYLKNIKDDSLDDISCPWDSKNHDNSSDNNFGLNFENFVHKTEIEIPYLEDDDDIYFKSDDNDNDAEVENDLDIDDNTEHPINADLKEEMCASSSEKGLVSFSCNICHLSVSRTELKPHFEKCRKEIERSKINNQKKKRNRKDVHRNKKKTTTTTSIEFENAVEKFMSRTLGIQKCTKNLTKNDKEDKKDKVKCEFCPRKFWKSHNLDHHIAEYHEKTICEQCG